MPVKEVPISDIRLDGGTQIRERIDEDTVADYAEKVKAGDDFPVVIIFNDGEAMWLADGFHRTLAHQKAEREKILADVRKGSQRDAILYALGANSNHGLRRSNVDKRRAVVKLLDDSQWRIWPDNKIADTCGVSRQFVTGIRESCNGYMMDKRLVTRAGRTYEMEIKGKSAPRKEQVITCPGCGDPRPNDPGPCPFCKAMPISEDAPVITDDGEPLIEIVEPVIIKPDPATFIEAGGCSTEDLNSLIAANKKFACIMADPPWQYGNQATRASTDNHYPTMTIADIRALPVKELAAENAHLHLWTTNGFLFECKELMEAWDFTYKSVMVWCKRQMGIGNYWRVSHEFLLLSVRGKCPFLNRGQMSWFNSDRTTHSTKPPEARKRIELVSPGPRLELFGRAMSPGWTVWGNQISKSMFDPEAA